MVYDSFGNGLRLKNIPGYDTVVVNTAKSLATRFRPNAGIIQSWNVTGGWQKERGWKCPVIIDNMMNLELLFRASEISGDPTFRNIAITHADKTLENHFRSDYSSYHVVDYDPETGAVRSRETAQGAGDESRWSRGQSWALYGYTATYRYTKEPRYLEQAKHIADFLVNEKNMPEDFVPLWDYDAAEYAKVTPAYEKYVNQRDASAGAIMASASMNSGSTLRTATISRPQTRLSPPFLQPLTAPNSARMAASFSSTRWAASLTAAASTFRSTTPTTISSKPWSANATSNAARVP